MAEDSDRRARAGEYVLGVMSDGDRQRAERDLEVDPFFRDAVVEAAERMHVFDRPAEPAAPDLAWLELKERLSHLPQMRAGAAPVPRAEPEPPVTFGRRKTDIQRETLTPKPVRAPLGLHSVRGWRAALLAACLLAAFGLGYVAGISSVRAPVVGAEAVPPPP